jgi:hypothetical protein
VGSHSQGIVLLLGPTSAVPEASYTLCTSADQHAVAFLWCKQGHGLAHCMQLQLPCMIQHTRSHIRDTRLWLLSVQQGFIQGASRLHAVLPTSQPGTRAERVTG